MLDDRLLKSLLLVVALRCVTSAAPPPVVTYRETLPWAGWIGVNLSQFGQLVTLTVEEPSGNLIPVARSYDGRPWQVAPGPYADVRLAISCEYSWCGIDIAPINRVGRLKETVYTSFLDPNSEQGRNALVARFLEQATFGASFSDITSFYANFGNPGESSFLGWINHQISSIPLSSHREFHRVRTNPRWDRVSGTARSLKSPCVKNARWRTNALTSRDAALKKLSVEAFGSKYLLKIDGEPRTVLDSIELHAGAPPLVLGTEYTMCAAGREFWQEAVGQPFPRIRVNEKCYSFKNGSPPLNLDGLTGITLLDLTGADLTPMDFSLYNSTYWTSLEAIDDYILFSDFNGPGCAALPSPFGKGGKPGPTIFGRWRDMYLAYDPRLVLESNTVENPLYDGGGTAVVETNGQMMCSNAPRSFINEDRCVLSTSTSACSSKVPPTSTVQLNQANLKTFTDSGAYTYAFVDIPITRATFTKTDGTTEFYLGSPPCNKFRTDSKTRFERMPASACAQNPLKVQQQTRDVFAKYLKPEFDDAINPNPRYKTIGRMQYNQCALADQADWNLFDLGYMTGEDGTCWKHVHPLEGNVYDISTWPFQSLDIRTWMKDGNTNVLSLSMVWAGIDGNKWMYDTVHQAYPLLPGHLDDVVKFALLPNNLATANLMSAIGKTVSNPAGDGVVVCGSVGEISNNPSYGDGFQYAWDHYKDDLDVAFDMVEQRHTVWAYLALKAPDQLRQRMAWALSQICVVGFAQLDDLNTESVLQYYDIFVRHAFGSYRDIMKKVAFSEAMATFLSSKENKSYQYSRSRNINAFPDENFAREILQLFTLGLIRLNMDGTPIVGANGEPIETYNNFDLRSYGRAWTGLDDPAKRGNNDGFSGRVDPMNVINDWHDVFPKTDLMGGYIGDRNYPLCTDLPKRHALRKGATYRLLGSSNTPELMYEPTASTNNWGDKPFLERLELSTASPLYKVLCAEVNGSCTYPAKVVLSQNLDYSDLSLRNGLEYVSESLRTIRVRSGPSAIYYEYVRQPCVELSFFRDGIKVQNEPDLVAGSTPRVYTVDSSLCADPRRDVATESCCPLNYVEGDSTSLEQGYKFCKFFGERMSYDNAAQRCAANGMKACTAQRYSDLITGYCGYGRSQGHYLFWTTQGCQLQVKINADAEIAIVHAVVPAFDKSKKVWAGVGVSTQNFFRPAWISKFDFAQCGATLGCQLVTGGCLCNILVDESVAFSSAPASKADIVRECFIGGVDPSMAPEEYNDLGNCGIADIAKVYSKRSSSCSRLGPDVVFQYTDDFGLTRFAKNMVSRVEIGDAYSFRTPVQFLSLVDPELRDTLYEFEAVIDSIFYHPNHPPFMAKSLLQRFGHSNPSPNIVKTVAEAYKAGTYNGIGSNRYGDLGALIAAILLHPESTSLSLLSDPTFGQLREPLVKVVSFMRSMDYQHDSPLYIPLLDNLQSAIRQGTYEQPSVFNYYLPEYSPPGPIGASGLVSPESMLLAGDAVTNLLDGLFRMTKVGLDDCYAGLANYGPLNCAITDGDTSLSLGALGFTNTVGTHEQVLDQLTLTLTAARLSDEKRELIRQSTSTEFNSGNRDKAIRAMMQLIVSTAEFQTTSLAQNYFTPRPPKVSTTPDASDYKAVIYFFFNGGMDSYSLLAPKEACYSSFLAARGPALAVPLSDLLDIDATSGTGQACSTFGVHKDFTLGKELYDANELSFFANMGLLQFPVDKFNYTLTDSRLFSHNSQQYDVQRLDIKNIVGETGVGGRLMDELAKKGYKTSSNSVSTHAHAAAGDPRSGNPTRQVSTVTPENFNRDPTLPTITDLVKGLNGISPSTNNIFGETWSAGLTQSLVELEEAYSITQNPVYSVPNFKPTPSPLDRQFQATARFIKSRQQRNVNRELFVIEDGGYDMHKCNCVNAKLAYIDSTLRAFRAEMINQGMWDKVVIVTGSDFGRTLTPNSGGGTDHAWGGHYFMMGGDVRGKQILGAYPDLSSTSLYNIDARGRMVPTLPYDAMWTGVAQWMGVTDEDRISYMLPERKNFRKCSMFTDSQLFKSGTTPAYPCT